MLKININKNSYYKNKHIINDSVNKAIVFFMLLFNHQLMQFLLYLISYPCLLISDYLYDDLWRHNFIY